jgi:hypothetical protein
MDAVLIALVEKMQVQINIAEEAQREKDFYNKGVEAMRLSRGTEASDFTAGNCSKVIDLVILREGY